MNKSNKTLIQYAGMATQFLVAIAVSVYIGKKIDEWQKFEKPLAIWLLPLLFIIGMMMKIIRDTSVKNKK
ncbi:MAG: AtpZ/AtpI family protein [Ferruginibacter sp.]